MGFDLLQPWWLLLLPLAALPLLRRRSDTLRFSAVAWLPPDPWGRAAGFLWRAFACGAMAHAALLRGQLAPARLQGREQGVERLVALQAAQVLGVGAADVDGDVVGVREHAFESDQVVVHRVLDRRRGVLADVQAEHAAGGAKAACALHVGDEGVEALVVEAQAVDQRVGGRQAEHARLRIAGLRLRRHRADLDEAEAHRAQAVDAAAVLVQAGGQADAVRELQPRHADGVGHARLLPQAHGRRVLQLRDAAQRELVGLLGVEAEEEGAGESVGQRQHGRGLSQPGPAARAGAAR